MLLDNKLIFGQEVSLVGVDPGMFIVGDKFINIDMAGDALDELYATIIVGSEEIVIEGTAETPSVIVGLLGVESESGEPSLDDLKFHMLTGPFGFPVAANTVLLTGRIPKGIGRHIAAAILLPEDGTITSGKVTAYLSKNPEKI